MHATATRTRTPARHVRQPDLLRWPLRALAAWRQRRTLAALPPELLDDVGLSRDAADAEARRPIWDVPSHWLR